MTRTTGQPGRGSGRSKATATELLDRVQETMGDLASIARASYGPYDLSVLRVEMMLVFAEQNIAELRARSDELGPVSPTDEEGSPPSQPDTS